MVGVSKRKNVVFIKNEVNRWLSYCRNKSIGLAKGEFIAFADSDDVNMKDRFKKQVDFMEKNEDVDLLTSNVILIDEDGKEIGRTENSNQQVRDFVRNPFSSGVPFHNPTVFARSSLFDEEKYDESLSYGEDTDFFIRIHNKSNPYIISEPLVKKRVRTDEGHAEMIGKSILMGAKSMPKYFKDNYNNPYYLMQLFKLPFHLILSRLMPRTYLRMRDIGIEK